MLAKELTYQYQLKESAIASYLDVAQAAVSKYLSGKYSEHIKEIEAKIDKRLLEPYIRKLAEGKKIYANICMCTVCGTMNKFECAFTRINAAEEEETVKA